MSICMSYIIKPLASKIFIFRSGLHLIKRYAHTKPLTPPPMMITSNHVSSAIKFFNVFVYNNKVNIYVNILYIYCFYKEPFKTTYQV